ncbi:MAG: ferrous iron transport protein B [Verrucomicrobia bacterium]|nr:MAG: ferrous iron transport protein B [Verrucomicrobiota bacterium]
MADRVKSKSAFHLAGDPSGTPVYAFVGNPNSGKTTLFNALTGMRQKVGNYPGVTVERKVGEFFSQHGHPIRVIDLPGAYSLVARSPDEAILRDVLLGRRLEMHRPDRVVCVVDASNLERNLYLVFQVLELGLPTILVLNMIDQAERKGVAVDPKALERELGIPVVACQANSGHGLVPLKVAMSRIDLPPPERPWLPGKELKPAVEEIVEALEGRSGQERSTVQAEAILILSEEEHVRVAGSVHVGDRAIEVARRHEAEWEARAFDWRGEIVSSRYESITGICSRVMRRERNLGPSVSDRIDSVVVHPIWGWATLAAVMTVLFLAIFTLAEYPMGLIDSMMAGLGSMVTAWMPPGDLRSLIVDGAIAGVGGVVIFLPQIMILFFFVGLLEASGYMARAAFIMDRLMSRVGLNGKSFIPLLSSFACAIPGIMATRTIEDPKDRLVTILVAPLMSCSARLPVYLLMIAALIPSERVPIMTKVGIMSLMYILGTGAAFGFAWLFKRVLMRGEPSLMIIELPPYRRPSLRNVVMQMLERASLFLRKAGTIILGISIVLWFLSTYPKSPESVSSSEAVAQSFAGHIGHALEPVIEPLGFDWRIGIGLIASFAAREVFVSSIAVVFSVDQGDEEGLTPLRQALLAAEWPNGSPLFTPLVCFTLMVFYVFAMQCVSTIVIVKRETNSWRWPLFQLVYLTGTAYVVSLIVFQGGRLLGLG